MEMLLQGENLTKEQAKRTNPVTLAFVGDAVYALYVRERLVKSNAGKVGDYQRSSAKILSARGQSEFLAEIEELFTEEEKEIFLRGRNAKKATKSKNASPAEYNRSTGLESVIGFLYLTGDVKRIEELLSALDDEKFQTICQASAFKPSH
ncbi:MAG: Mini-ribonuclease 3 [Clostridiales bacterium]|nr:Mini-ribonuclease 3 [Clostridiales bacterium]